MENTKWFTGPVIIALVLGLIVGFAAGTYTSPSRVESDAIIDGEATSTDSILDGIGVGDVSVDVIDQAAGDQVTVSDIKLDKVSWIAVRNYDNNTLGSVLGAYRLPAGVYASQVVDLLRPTVTGKIYAVTIFYDDGDLAFSSKSDALVMQGDQPFMVTFVAK